MRNRLPGKLTADVWRHLRARDQRPRPEVKAKLRVTNAEPGAAGPTRIDLMDEIGFWGITAQDFVDELLAIDSDEIDLHVNSPGGDVFDGVAIMNALADHPATVNVFVDGLAASAASFIAMAGDSVHMGRGAQLMIHDALGLCVGNAADMEQMKTLLDRISDTIAGLYADRAGGDVDEWRDLMRAETWYSGPEAVAAGLADTTGAKAAEEDPAEGDDEDPPEGDDPPADPDKGDDDEDEDEDMPMDPAAKFAAAFSRFAYAGRAQAPPPPTPGKTPVAIQLEPGAVLAAIREGVKS